MLYFGLATSISKNLVRNSLVHARTKNVDTHIHRHAYTLKERERESEARGDAVMEPVDEQTYIEIQSLFNEN